MIKAIMYAIKKVYGYNEFNEYSTEYYKGLSNIIK